MKIFYLTVIYIIVFQLPQFLISRDIHHHNEQTHKEELIKICKSWGKIKYSLSPPDQYSKCDSLLVQYLRSNLYDSNLCEAQFQLFAEQYFPQLCHTHIINRDSLVQIPYYMEQQREMIFSPEYRLFSLFDMWNVFRFYYAYLDLVDENWEQVLENFIPKFVSTNDSLSYLECVLQFSTCLNDSHVRVYSPILDSMYSFIPPIEVNSIEQQTVVTSIIDSVITRNTLQPGDILQSVDGKPISEFYSQWKMRIAASTKQYFNWRFHRYLLASDSLPVTLGIIRDAIAYTIKLPRSHALQPTLLPFAPQQKVVLKLSPSLTYVDLTRLQSNQIDSVFSHLNTQGIILDIRGYPQVTFDKIFSWLSESPKIIAQSLSYPVFYHLLTERLTKTLKKQVLYPTTNRKVYKGKIVVLLNASTISRGEHTCLTLLQSRTTRNIRFVGGATAGANGEVKYITVGNKIRVRFTSVDIRHADGRQLQRIGIQPDVFVEPTIKGIREGRDEVLEKGIEVLQNLLNKKQDPTKVHSAKSPRTSR